MGGEGRGQVGTEVCVSPATPQTGAGARVIPCLPPLLPAGPWAWAISLLSFGLGLFLASPHCFGLWLGLGPGPGLFLTSPCCFGPGPEPLPAFPPPLQAGAGAGIRDHGGGGSHGCGGVQPPLPTPSFPCSPPPLYAGCCWGCGGS